MSLDNNKAWLAGFRRSAEVLAGALTPGEAAEDFSANYTVLDGCEDHFADGYRAGMLSALGRDPVREAGATPLWTRA